MCFIVAHRAGRWVTEAPHAPCERSRRTTCLQSRWERTHTTLQGGRRSVHLLSGDKNRTLWGTAVLKCTLENAWIGIRGGAECELRGTIQRCDLRGETLPRSAVEFLLKSRRWRDPSLQWGEESAVSVANANHLCNYQHAVETIRTLSRKSSIMPRRSILTYRYRIKDATSGKHLQRLAWGVASCKSQ